MSAAPDVVRASAQRLRVAAFQLAAEIDEMTGCTPEQRATLRGLPMLLLREADTIAPECAPIDPALEGGNVIQIGTKRR